jgi:CheY-like chemotaxis protein
MLGSSQAPVPAQVLATAELKSNCPEARTKVAPLIAGRKLLIAADTPYYRKVIGLTFTDEGMEVTTVADGQEALESLEQGVPDVILADVSMPVIGGYELCELIKQSERFRRIPVMLLVGSFEPFDEAEARRVGADDVVTKPFQSIRQLVSRVGSLLAGKTGDEESSAHDYSTLGLEHSNAAPSAPDVHAMPESNVKVFVEAPSMTETDSTESHEPAGSACSADIDLQTADTMKLERIGDEPPAPVSEAIAYAQDDTAQMESVSKTEQKEDSSANVRFDEPAAGIGAPEMSEQPTQQTTTRHDSAVFDDALLDLGDFDTTPRALAEDVILDLDYEEPAGEPLGEALSELGATAAQPAPESAVAFEAAAPVEIIATASSYEEVPVAVVERQGWAIVAEALPVSVVEEEQSAGEPSLALSPEAIDAIARRAVEHLSDKVVREIAWEVVPELAELLIKKKLEEQK